MNTGICPVCNGTKKIPLTEEEKKQWWYKDQTERECFNCGGSTMYGKASGFVRLRPDGTPCKHEYIGRNAGRCYTIYTCKHCGDFYDIDSGD